MHDHDSEPPPIISERLTYQLIRVAHLLKQIRLEMGTISRSQGAVLGYLFHHQDGVTAAALRRMLGITAASMSKILQQMEQEALITRTPNPNDARSMLIYLAEQGREHLKLFPKILEAMDTVMFAGFSEAERDQFKAFLKRMRDNLEDPERKAKMKIVIGRDEEEFSFERSSDIEA